MVIFFHFSGAWSVRTEPLAVDRILRQQKAERLAAEEARVKAQALLTGQSGASSSADTLVSAPPKGGPLPLPGKDALIEHDAPPPEDPSRASKPMGTIRQSLDFLKRKRKGDDSASIAGPSDAPPLPAKDRDSPGSNVVLPPPPRPDRPRTPNPHATPRNVISAFGKKFPLNPDLMSP